MKKYLVAVVFLSMLGYAPLVHAAATDTSDGCGIGATMNAEGDCTPINTPAPSASTGSGSGFTALAPIPGLTDISPTAVVNSATLANFFNNLYKYLVGLAAILAIIEIIWGGLEIATKDSVSKQSDGRQRITQAIYGLILVLSPVLVFSIINPSILNLSLNLPALKTATQQSQTNQPNGAATGTFFACSTLDKCPEQQRCSISATLACKKSDGSTDSNFTVLNGNAGPSCNIPGETPGFICLTSGSPNSNSDLNNIQFGF